MATDVAQTESQPRLIFGIDFGTTYSGVSFGLSGQTSDKIRTVQNWQNVDPDKPDKSEQVKAPSVIRYDEQKGVQWGYGVSGDGDMRWLKLLLLDDRDLQQYLSDTPAKMSHLLKMREVVRQSGKDVVDIIADYLRLLWEHAVKEVEGIVHDGSLINRPFTIVATVPAIWKGYAKSRMRLAFKKAGILDDRILSDGTVAPTLFHFASEPEAAALARLTDLVHFGSIKAGDCFTVVDFGGGTVDIISYRVTDDSPLRIEEVVEGTGGLCGVTFLDQDFRGLVISRLGPENWDRVDREDIVNFLEARWELGLKRTYNSGVRGYNLPMNDSFRDVTNERRITLEEHELRTLFTGSYSMTESTKLLERQLAAVKDTTENPPKFVILAGGFGSSATLREAVNSIVEEGTSILGGSDSSNIWSAVSRGAVMSVAEGLLDGEFVKVQSRIARACYGIVYSTPWREGVHDPRDKYWCPIRGRYEANNQCSWFLKKGERSSKPEPFEKGLVRHYKPDEPRTYPNVDGKVWTYNDLNPPSRKEPGVEKYETIPCESTIPWAELPVELNGEGKPMKVYEFRYAAMCFGDSVDISLIGPDGAVKQTNIDIESGPVHTSPPQAIPTRPLVPRPANVLPRSSPAAAPQAPVSHRSTEYNDEDDLFDLSDRDSHTDDTKMGAAARLSTRVSRTDPVDPVVPALPPPPKYSAQAPPRRVSTPDVLPEFRKASWPAPTPPLSPPPGLSFVGNRSDRSARVSQIVDGHIISYPSPPLSPFSNLGDDTDTDIPKTNNPFHWQNQPPIPRRRPDSELPRSRETVTSSVMETTTARGSTSRLLDPPAAAGPSTEWQRVNGVVGGGRSESVRERNAQEGPSPKVFGFLKKLTKKPTKK
ncbi:hypothetical protein QBC47DRAFT_404895 [Echria macrotheca]|uniref:Uncharacterized protein n=1 Tax=Echria macrotheca TaxID=438768 RepID=A0AAJ0B6F8_9PEZI|nr:hypothetical protein QBC47DRAFT_404895 [Echria macrotheca]